MKRLLLGLAILPFVAGVALAAQPLNDKQMDKVVAGHDLSLVETTDVSEIIIRVNEPPVLPPTGNTTVGDVILPLTTIQVIWQAIP
jgi:hypothetical protein